MQIEESVDTLSRDYLSPDLPETKFVDGPDGRVAYQEVGSGPTLILIHGGGPGAYGFSNFRRNFTELADRGYHVVTVDLPGYGQSQARQGESVWHPNADAVRELIVHLGVGKASLVGNSLGGGTAIRLTLDHPDLVDKLILMGPGGSLPATSTFPTEGLKRMFDFYEGEGPTLEKLERVIDLLVFDRSKITPQLVEERLRTARAPATMANPPLRAMHNNLRNDLWREELERIHHPTLLVWGQEDRVIPLDLSFMLLKRIPNADLHVFSQCGHWAQWERADEFNELVANFVARS